MTDADAEADHDCTAHIEPIIDKYDADGDEHVISATNDGGEVLVFMACRECGREFQSTYEYVDTEPV